MRMLAGLTMMVSAWLATAIVALAQLGGGVA
jgi:hypothetical protein